MVYMSTAMLSSDGLHVNSHAVYRQWQLTCMQQLSMIMLSYLILGYIFDTSSQHFRNSPSPSFLQQDTMCHLIWGEAPCVISPEARHHGLSHLRQDTMGHLIWGKTPCIISAKARHHVSSHLRRDTMGHLIWSKTPCVISPEARHMCHLIWGETPCVISSEVRHHESYLIGSWIVALITSHLVLKCQQGVIICTLDLQASFSVWTLLILQVNDEKRKLFTYPVSVLGA